MYRPTYNIYASLFTYTLLERKVKYLNNIKNLQQISLQIVTCKVSYNFKCLTTRFKQNVDVRNVFGR